MATSLDPPPQEQAQEEPNVQYVLTGSGTTNDGKSLDGIVFVDPTTGLAMVPGSVTFTSLSIADGADVAEGATTDAATANTVIGRLKKLISLVPTALTGSGNLKTALQEALPAGTNLLGKVGIDQTTPGTTNAVVITGADPDSYTRADTYTAAANGVSVDMTANPGLVYALQIKGTGAAASAWNIVLETSLDGTNWSTDITHTNGGSSDGQILSATAHPRLYMRSRCVSVTLGSATNIVATILALR